MVDEGRFDWGKRETEGLGTKGVSVIVDRATGVQYLFAYWGSTSGMTLLVDREGRPLLSTDPSVMR
ncbi:MAG: DUF6440 family protein [Propionibacteriaceae bacterium]|jgi:hypothetical protein|nr:DUF6440 family protein [Propionibacteriaceae bacterium]